MELSTKRLSASIMLVVMLLVLVAGTGLLVGVTAFAATESDHAYKYFYGQLIDDSMEQRFYKAFESLAGSGLFKKGVFQYDLVANNAVTEDEASVYVNGSTRMAEAFGAGRDAFYMDHPDLFYADVFSTSVSAGQNGNGNSVAYLDTSRALNTYRGNLNSEQAVNAAIEKYEAELAKVVGEADKKAGVKEKVEYVNSYLAETVKYGYGTVVEGDRNVDTEKAAFIFTSYGALVNKESVCEGYAKAFKAILDRLGIPCVCVQGYADGGADGTYEPHMWNYVQVDGHWYMVDPTYNSSSGKQWFLCGGEAMTSTHLEDGSVSSSGYKLKYPALKPYDYGNDKDSNGMTIIGEYIGEDSHRQLDLHVSYDGKGAVKLEEEGKYLSFRGGAANEEGGIDWTDWYNIIVFNQALKEILDQDEYPYPITDTETVIKNISWEYIQFALMDSKPTLNTLEYGDKYYISYDSATVDRAVPSAAYRNEMRKDQLNPAPFGTGYPSNTGSWPYDRTYDITIKYSDKLERLDKALPAGLEFYVSVSNDIAQEKAKIENFKWEEGSDTISFTFTPSRMFIHSDTAYYFTLTNVVGKKSHKIPDPVMYYFKGKSVVCSKVFNDGRLYMSVFGTPQLLDNSDLSVTDFKDENGKYYAESQRSQLMLVATKKGETQQMNDLLKDEMGVQSDDVVASSTYEIDLQLCGVVRKVPNGSYMQVSFGFPEGYDASDAGTTFKIYHYTHDDGGKITGVEEIPVIVTEYGLIAQVKSFSPFTIVQIKNSSAAVGSSAKSIYANVNGGIGGTVTSEGKSGIIAVDKDTVVYDIAAADGYVVGAVLLNGKLIDGNDYKGGKLTLNSADLAASNMLEVRFVTATSADYYSEQGVKLAYGGSVSKPIIDDFTPPPAKKNVVGIVVGVLCGVIALALIGFAIWWFLIKNKKQPAKEAAATVAKSGGASAKKSAAADKTSVAAAKKPAVVLDKTSRATTEKPAAAASKSSSATSKKPATTEKKSASAAKADNSATSAKKPASAKNPASSATKQTKVNTTGKATPAAKPTGAKQSAAKPAASAKKPTVKKK